MAKKKKEKVAIININKQLLIDIKEYVLEISGKSTLSDITPEMSLNLNLNLDSLNFLECVQMISNKYDINVKTEELDGVMTVANLIFVFETKIRLRYENDQSKLKEIINNKISEDKKRIPEIQILSTSFLSNYTEEK